jgi:hypothetical protein
MGYIESQGLEAGHHVLRKGGGFAGQRRYTRLFFLSCCLAAKIRDGRFLKDEIGRPIMALGSLDCACKSAERHVLTRAIEARPPFFCSSVECHAPVASSV